ncbi:bifunctional DNA-formamidopyrimidine glycosylase/DNA-(apurinic or apyrimidinic site) lyase [Nordella sp. HKS 07]|uniref:bifunctional DNA-formamidopyrimidine glycosylase/DNA-(apurinic or apyrimidinic site) lyase n=1 Tax=Nordella sp. HKS 07 TaxID=2712222 RepID=UPI0013E13A64|nr:bifunctional DNA-formamidopyrimidine glycosylase/DNA-(apurinic or apyrimidinic site) lyase [Nordella sp. HKS 07]QIG48718.1 bifunctional DNA-formamidopyrimidine glycosylase/DNA-(apurinic or apyrimidinic site) lyase [Nordella sp. HKS 07]
MPELPEVETVMRGLETVLTGQRITHVRLARDNLRFPFPPDFGKRIEGRLVLRLQRRAKYILVFLEGGDVMIVHLGMSGRFTIIDARGRMTGLGEFYDETATAESGSGPHDHVVFTRSDGLRIVYTDPRRFGVMDLVAEEGLGTHRLLAQIGVEPLGNEFGAATLAQGFRGKKAPLKAALLDQTLVAGLGNIYVCEALHRAGLSPKRRASSLVKKTGYDSRLEDLARNIRAVLTEAIAAGGSTLRDFVHPQGEKGSFQQVFAVYDREGEKCPKRGCGGTIRRIVQSGRSTFYCPKCQK